MEWIDEAGDTQESSRRSAGPVRRSRAQRGQAAGQSRKWPQGGIGQKSQEDNHCPAQLATIAARSPETLIETVIASICARFGDRAIGLGGRGIRFVGGRWLRR